MKRFGLFTFVIFFLMMFMSCSPAEQTIRLYILSTGEPSYEGFNGYYIKNGKSMIQISSDDVTYGSHIFNQIIEDVDSIRISVTGKLGISDKEILIFVDDELVKEASNSGETTLTLTYEWGEEDNSTTDTSS